MARESAETTAQHGAGTTTPRVDHQIGEPRRIERRVDGTHHFEQRVPALDTAAKRALNGAQTRGEVRPGNRSEIAPARCRLPHVPAGVNQTIRVPVLGPVRHVASDGRRSTD